MTLSNDPRKNEENGEDLEHRNGHFNPPDNPQHNTDESEDSDPEDGHVQSGYELLPQGENGQVHQAENDSSSEPEDDDTPHNLEDILRQIPPSERVQEIIQESQRSQEREVIAEREVLFNQSSGSNSNGIDLSKDRVESIRSAMAGFQLPASAIPSWASNLPEEEWQKIVNDKISTTFQKK